MADGFIQVPADQIDGKRVDTDEHLNINQVTVERQKVAIPDVVDIGGDLLTQMLVEQRIQNMLLIEGLKLDENIDGLREELSDIAGLTTPATRELLTANRTYYVSSSGSDSNNGLSAASAFLTLQKPIDVLAASIDMTGFTVTIDIANGTYTAGVAGKVMVGQATTSSILFTGDTTTPSNVLISTTSQSCFTASGAGVKFTVEGVEMRTATSGACLDCSIAGNIEYQNVRFGTCAGPHVTSFGGGSAVTVNASTSYVIAGNATIHFDAETDGVISSFATVPVTLTGTPAFSQAFANSDAGQIVLAGYGPFTFTGGATGIRYNVATGGIIQTYGAGATYFPGDVAGAGGTTAGSGFYA